MVFTKTDGISFESVNAIKRSLTGFGGNEMKKRKQKSLQCEIYEQMASMKCAHVRKKCGIISFCNETFCF